MNMRNLVYVFFVILSFGLILSSCSEDDGTGTDPDAPIISVLEGDQEVPVGSSLNTYEVFKDGNSADANSDFLVDGSVASSNPVLILDATDQEGFRKTFSLLAPAAAGSTTSYTIEVTDMDGLSNSVTVNVSTPIVMGEISFEFDRAPGQNTYAVMADASVLRTVKFSASAGDFSLSSITVERGEVAVDATDLLFGGAPESNPFPLEGALQNSFTDYGISFRAPSNGGQTFSYTIILTDDNGDSKSLLLDVTAVATLDGPFTGQFYHMDGAAGCFGGYDLVNDQNISASGMDADRDMLNTDVAPNPFTGSWMSENGTQYVATTLVTDINDVNKANAESIYSTGTPSSSVNNPSAGDFYVARLRGGSEYAVIRIDRIDANDNSCNMSTGNRGIIEFTYVKG
jgi:hypothetical protein